MAVHAAHYPASYNLLLLHRADQEERKENMDLRFQDSVSKNLGKRARETLVPNPLFNLASQQAQSNLVSTGLRLSFDDQQQQIQLNNQSNINNNHNNNINSSVNFANVNPSFSEELFTQMAHQTNEIELFLMQQTEQLRRALSEKRRRQHASFLQSVEALTARRLTEKQSALDSASRRTAELQSRLSLLRSDSLSWQAQALALQSTAAHLHSQLSRPTAEPGRAGELGRAGEMGRAGEVGDAESGFVDPGRGEREVVRVCRACRMKPACVVVFPCRHLCMCEGCEERAGQGEADTCPVCCCVRSGSLKVFFA